MAVLLRSSKLKARHIPLLIVERNYYGQIRIGFVHIALFYPFWPKLTNYTLFSKLFRYSGSFRIHSACSG